MSTLASRREAAGDPRDRLYRAAFALTHRRRTAGIFASEAAVPLYALGSWRRAAHVPADAVPFTHHERSGQGGVVLGFLLLLAIEGVAVHLLLTRWSPVLAWVLTAVTVYGGLWIIADYRATVLRPILVTGGHIRFRAGLRWDVTVPREMIAGVGREDPGLGRESLKLSWTGSPTHWITLTEPREAFGPYGLARRVRAIGLEPDDPAGFERLLRERESSPSSRS